ncbi:hypothetical protein CYMTET_26891 [Cymbomonas tetramitiformis]|uniref:Uncharacterized protein n=1 Tax=Cymbomonas tetramitiformis TaxID=36881 RepID=A0AAE0FRH8_9CHLO|nr:hypothetical protein CYMTET_26891 [Cymbomonas tetramitiformis]
MGSLPRARRLAVAVSTGGYHQGGGGAATVVGRAHATGCHIPGLPPKGDHKTTGWPAAAIVAVVRWQAHNMRRLVALSELPMQPPEREKAIDLTAGKAGQRLQYFRRRGGPSGSTRRSIWVSEEVQEIFSQRWAHALPPDLHFIRLGVSLPGSHILSAQVRAGRWGDVPGLRDLTCGKWEALHPPTTYENRLLQLMVTPFQEDTQRTFLHICTRESADRNSLTPPDIGDILRDPIPPSSLRDWTGGGCSLHIRAAGRPRLHIGWKVGSLCKKGAAHPLTVCRHPATAPQTGGRGDQALTTVSLRKYLCHANGVAMREEKGVWPSPFSGRTRNTVESTSLLDYYQSADAGPRRADTKAPQRDPRLAARGVCRAASTRGKVLLIGTSGQTVAAARSHTYLVLSTALGHAAGAWNALLGRVGMIRLHVGQVVWGDTCGTSRRLEVVQDGVAAACATARVRHVE